MRGLPRPAGCPASLYRAAAVRALDACAIDTHGIAGITLMERAAASVLRALRRRWPRARRLLVACGGGNNGGDGFLVAMLARQAGFEVVVRLVGDPERLRGDAATARDRARAAGVRFEPGPAVDPGTDVVVDALLGTGLEREVGGRFADAVDAINAAAVPVIAVDLPSGVHADTGAVLGRAVRADHTVSFIGLKPGLFTGAGRGLVGELEFDALGVPDAVYQAAEPVALRVTAADFAGHLAPREVTGHKGRYGHVLVIGGDVGMAGAARLAGAAALRAGAGLVSVATRAGHAATLGATRPELMVRPVESAGDLAPLLERATVVAIGPGLGTGAWGREMLGALGDAPHPRVIDADALNLVADGAGAGSSVSRILTPHPGEAARLLGADTGSVEADRLEAARRIRESRDAVVVLKGAGTVIDGGAGPARIVDAGNPGMASAGMGDVLTGVIAALLAQGMLPGDAAACGACVHAAAGDRAAGAGERGLVAGDVIEALRLPVNRRGG